MRLEPLYRVRFGYSDGWSVELGSGSAESQNFFLGDGRAEGKVTGSVRVANAPHRRSDGTFLPDLRGVIETDDGATLLFTVTGYGRAYPVGRRQVVGTALHVSDDPRYRRLNDVVCPLVGEVRAVGEDDVEIVLDVAELVWEPLDD